MTAPTEHDLDAARAELRRRRLSRFAPETLLWLAALPEWSDRLAEAIGFPATEPLPELVERLATAGLVQQREVLDASGEVLSVFWLPASRRKDVGHHLRQLWPAAETYAQVQRLAAAVERHSTPLTDALQHWLLVVTDHLRDPSGLGLINQVDELVGQSRPTEALSLVGAAQALGDVLGDPLASSARRAQWRLERAHRQALDARTLEFYLPRPELEDALDELVTGAGAWAVHLLGDGGVGKTMAIRYLASGQLTDRRGRPPVAVARIDFDHLDPRYPQRRPAELLLALATELTGDTTTREGLYRRRHFEDVALALHEELLAHPDTDVDAPMLSWTIDVFSRYLDSFPSGVILVLDTCEELAKLHAPGARSPAVDRTFEILEAIRDRTSRMRVLLAGRRWLVPRQDGGAQTGVIELSPRPYLRVLQVGGFTPSQAHDYLDLRDPDAELPGALRTALVDRAENPGTEEVNPFELTCYCDWALDEPSLDVEILRQAPGDPYVEQRIIGRLTDIAVRESFAVAVELGRFDQEMIAPALTRRGIDAEAAFAGLAGQEWVSAVSFRQDGQPRVIEVDEHLRDRFRAVVTRNPGRFPIDRAQLGSDLAAMVITRPVEDLPVEAVEAALRLLALPRAAAMWAGFEQRIAAENAWGWASQVLPRLAAVEADRAGLVGSSILGLIRATQAAAALRQPGRPGLAALWDDVIRLAPRHPGSGQVAVLTARARWGRIAASGHYERFESPAGVPRDSLLAALDALTASGERLPVDLEPVLDTLCDPTGEPALRTAALLVRASARLAAENIEGSLAAAEEALVAAEAGEPTRWTDWAAPVRLRDRARLVRVVLALMHAERPEQLPLTEWRAEASGHLAQIDAERLTSATIGLELAWRLVDPEVLDQAVAAEAYHPQRQPTHHWHRRVDSLCSTLARAVAVRGEVGRAVEALRHRRELAVSSGEDPTTITDCDEMLVQLCRSFRTTELSSSIPRLAREGPPELRAQAWAVLALVQGQSPETVEEAGSWRGWWQAQIRRPDEPQPSRWTSAPDPDPIGGAPIAPGVDAREVRQLREQPPIPAHLMTTVLRRRAEQGLLLLWGTDGLGAALRADALTEGELIGEALDALPPRLVAETALAEGELLALRLPAAATTLLARAARGFLAAGDPLGAARANLLGALATARAGVTEVPRFEGEWPPEADRQLGEPWSRRHRLVTGEKSAASDDPSPELDLRPFRPPPSPFLMEAMAQRSDGYRLYPSSPPRPAPTPPSSPRLTSAPPPATPTPAPAERDAWRGWIVVITLLVALPVGGIPAVRSGTLGLVLTILAIVGVVTGATVYLLGPRPSEQRSLRRHHADGWVVMERAGSQVQRSTGQPSVGAVLSARSAAWFRCQVIDDESSILIERGPAIPAPEDAPVESRWPYLLVPLVETDPDVTSVWEQMADGSAPRLGGKTALCVRFRPSPAVLHWEIAVTRDPSWRMAQPVYQGPYGLGPRDASPGPSVPRTVLHLIGTPVRTSAGWRMRVGGAVSEASRKDSRGKLEGEELLGPDDLAAGRNALVVLQAEPVDEPSRPLGPLRGGMCALARDLRDAGAGAVLVVPPLSDARAADVVSVVRARMSQHRDRMHPIRVLDLLAELREQVAAAGAVSPPGERAEADLLLFV